MRVSILGSCITRDVFRLFPDEAEVASYHARSSLISLMSAPMEIQDAGACWPSNFARKTVLADCRKTFFDDLEAATPDVLIVDLMSERFDLLRGGGTYVTRSWELTESGLPGRRGAAFERVSRESKLMQEAWLARAAQFAGALRERLPDVPVILHRAYWTLEYRDRGSVRTFPRAWWRSIRERNEIVAACHEHLERLMPELVTVEARPQRVADPHHRWGLGTSHYERAYYDDVCEQIHARAA